MQCPNCKELLPDDSTFCQYCGAMLDADAQTACPDAGQRETMTTPEVGLRRRASRKRERGRKAPRFLFHLHGRVFGLGHTDNLCAGDTACAEKCKSGSASGSNEYVSYAERRAD